MSRNAIMLDHLSHDSVISPTPTCTSCIESAILMLAMYIGVALLRNVPDLSLGSVKVLDRV